MPSMRKDLCSRRRCTSTEPPRADNPLLTARNCYITPHIAWATTAARERLMGIMLENLKAYMAGKPVNNVAK